MTSDTLSNSAPVDVTKLVTTTTTVLLIKSVKIKKKKDIYKHHFLASPHPSLVTRSKKSCWREEGDLIVFWDVKPQDEEEKSSAVS